MNMKVELRNTSQHSNHSKQSNYEQLDQNRNISQYSNQSKQSNYQQLDQNRKLFDRNIILS